jgi:hippurate hydrolase
MAVINRLAEFHDEITGWRHDLHRHPELSFDVERTAGLVADKLKSFGVDEVVTGIGRTGVVGVIRGARGAKGDRGRVIGLRADMDALPIREAVARAHASTIEGRMHACGHDGHTAMLLGAAKYLAETRNFSGNAIVIFQPAEEQGGGGREMVADGLMERFGIEEVYGLHNRPGLEAGKFVTRPGPVMASADEFEIRLSGRGGHAARPHQSIDLIVAGSAIVQGLQTIASRNADPVKGVVVSVSQFHAGAISNVLAQTASLSGTVRALDAATRDLAQTRLTELAETIARAYGAEAEVVYVRDYPVTVNDAGRARFAATVAAEVAGAANVDGNADPVMGAEDFSYMLEARPGAMMYIGNGPSAGLHNPAYDFNDAIIPLGCSYWVRLVETALG